MNISVSDVLIEKIRDLTGLRVGELDHEKLIRWIEDRSSHLGLVGSQAYLDYLGQAEDLSSDRQMLSHLLTTGETFFMRDPGQMELIRREILPEIIAKRAQEKRFRIWAPACATGEEVYSLIILLDAMLPQYESWQIDVIGSDIDAGFIHQAKVAIYREWAFRGCDEHFKENYFQKVAGGWSLSDRIRSRARFLEFDLVAGQLPDDANRLFEVDFILCRNLFIYMNKEAITAITNKLAACLAPGGVLMTGHGELHAYKQGGLQVKIYPESLVYQKIAPMEFAAPVNAITPIVNKVAPFHLVHNPRPGLEPTPIAPSQSLDELLAAAWYFADRSKFDEALKLSEQIYAQDPMQADLHYLHAVISMESGALEQAKIDLRKALYLDINFLPAYLDLIAIQIQEGKGALAAKTCEQAIHSLDAFGPTATLPHLKNSSLTDIRAYLSNLQNSLTLTNGSSKLKT